MNPKPLSTSQRTLSWPKRMQICYYFIANAFKKILPKKVLPFTRSVKNKRTYLLIGFLLVSGLLCQQSFCICLYHINCYHILRLRGFNSFILNWNISLSRHFLSRQFNTHPVSTWTKNIFDPLNKYINPFCLAGNLARLWLRFFCWVEI